MTSPTGHEPEPHPNGWSIRDVLAEIDKRNDARFSGSDRLHEQRFADFRTDANERDLRYQQRFDAQEKAVRDALAAAKEAVTAALIAADRAVTKAELASERRFEGVNEFRAQLADQAATLMPRAESTLILNTINDKVDVAVARIDERLSKISEAGVSTKSGHEGAAIIGDKWRTTMLAIASIAISLITVIVVVLVSTHA